MEFSQFSQFLKVISCFNSLNSLDGSKVVDTIMYQRGKGDFEPPNVYTVRNADKVCTIQRADTAHTLYKLWNVPAVGGSIDVASGERLTPERRRREDDDCD
ncbi:hypothetical protein HFX_6242 (plasmid) [Haloferax mediterranei ATCC 33500]|uniref:Uncharacterized protein n=1 Tax=Haloferax mediterranei (strain ATCC 33500 / DSM 1411 / JCM 8866 / NBRC 14739 / NCIMB 2177 / R-4) TaxID=523841 RepID=I3RAV5_HALMT|nr:hypothetical protein HFX_6242 [Haloferax mediterranei ATCC 33500]